MKLFLTFLIIFISITVNAQRVLKIKREDNRLLFYQIQKKNDTIISNKSDQFLIKLPDSLKSNLQIVVENGLFKAVYKDSSIYQLFYVKGMKYSHSKPDSLFYTQLEGICLPTKNIKITIYNSFSKKALLTNLYFAKY